MNSSELMHTYRQVKNNLFWLNIELNRNVKLGLQRKNNFEFVNKNVLKIKIENLLKFDINLLWDKSFWGLGQSDSICAFASEPYYFIMGLKNNPPILD